VVKPGYLPTTEYTNKTRKYWTTVENITEWDG